MRKRKSIIFGLLIVICTFLLVPGSCLAKETSSFARTVRTLQDSFEKSAEEAQYLQERNERLEDEVLFLKSEIARMEDVSKDAIADLDSEYGLLTKELAELRKENKELKASRAGSAKEDDYAKRLREFRESIRRRRMGSSEEGQSGNEGIVTKKFGDGNLRANEMKSAKRDEGEIIANKRPSNAKETGIMHYNLGNVYFRNGEYEKAAYEYEYARNLMPDDPDVYYNLAVVLDFHLGKGGKANEYYVKYLSLNPESEITPFIKQRIAETSLRAKVGN